MRVNPAQVKALFHHLVRACGGVEAAGARLGISHQRVSQLQSANHDDMPTIMHIASLEEFCGQPIVTGALARVATGQSLTNDPDKEISDVTIAQADIIALRRSGADPRQVKAAALRLVREAQEVVDSVDETGDAA